jgi:hypothetical protein
MITWVKNLFTKQTGQIYCGATTPDTKRNMGNHVCVLLKGHSGPHLCGRNYKFYGPCKHQWTTEHERKDKNPLDTSIVQPCACGSRSID